MLLSFESVEKNHTVDPKMDYQIDNQTKTSFSRDAKTHFGGARNKGLFLYISLKDECDAID